MAVSWRPCLRGLVALAAAALSGCGDDDGRASLLARAAQLPADASHFAHPPAAMAATRWPVLFSHAWSRTADTAFQGDRKQSGGEYDAYGVKQALEADGVVVYQPNKVKYASHEERGRLLYKRCAGATLKEKLCEGDAPVVEDGLHAAMLDYCASAARRQRHGFASEQACHQGLQFNIICHSQGCPDSRYMMATQVSELSGRPVYEHVASWTSMAGANKGTAQADFILEMLAACVSDQCRSPLLDLAFAVDEFIGNRALITDGSRSVVALSTKYMTRTTDMNCDPDGGDCPPGFNARYPLPEDPAHPIVYQSFVTEIRDISHPCYSKDAFFWRVINAREGANDGNISVTSQAFAHYGPGETGGRTPVRVRHVYGDSGDPAKPHPGLNHMAFSSSDVPGLPGVSCRGEDNSGFAFSRVNLYRNIVAELAGLGL